MMSQFTASPFHGTARGGLREWRSLGPVCMLLLALGGCGVEPEPTPFFPIEPGRSWSYRVTTEHGESVKTSTYSASTFSPDIAADSVPDAPPRPYWAKRDSNGTEFYFALTENGVERFAKRRVVDFVPMADLPRRPVLPVPARTGAVWAIDSVAYLVGKTGVYGDHTETSWPVRLTFTINAIDAEITTPAGTFSQCLEVEGSGKIELYLDGRRGFVEVPIVQREWYAPGVGLVRLERTEDVAESDRYFGGRRVFELTRFSD